MTTELILKPRPLSLEDLPLLQSLGRIEGDTVILERSPKGYKLKTPVAVPLERILAVGQKDLLEYVLISLLAERPKLIPFVLENQSLLKLADYFCYGKSGSLKTLYVYVDCIARYFDRIGMSPDDLIFNVKDKKGLVRLKRIPEHVEALKNYVRELHGQKLAGSRISNYVKAIRSFYRVNEIDVKLPYSLSRRSVRRDRAPKPDELQRLLDVADLREKVIISMLALAGFREGTLVRLRYHHVKEDLEKGNVPLHIHVEAEITKGKYHDYDTFVATEAVEYLRLYLEARRQGNIHPEIKPEEISDGSPLIRDEMYDVPRPIGEKQLYKLIHALYFKAGLLRKNQNGGYDLCVHSLRKYFKTQLMALGLQGDYVDYMMGHTVSTYHDIQSKGLEFLRGEYARDEVRIRPKPTISKHEMVIEAIRHMLTPEELQRVETVLSEPDTKYLDPEERQRQEIRALSQALRESLKRELLSTR